MGLDWRTIDRWVMGEAWTGARIEAYLDELCENIGPRWSSTDGEWKAVNYLCEQLRAAGVEYHSTSDWRDPGLREHPLPTVNTSREHGAVLRTQAGEGKSQDAKRIESKPGETPCRKS